jgi:hypothetical protein
VDFEHDFCHAKEAELNREIRRLQRVNKLQADGWKRDHDQLMQYQRSAIQAGTLTTAPAPDKETAMLDLMAKYRATS